MARLFPTSPSRTVSPLATTLLVLGFITMDLIIVGAVFYALGGTLRDLAQKFPPQDTLDGAVRKEFQSFRIDMLNLGGCIHATADEQHLHLEPTLIIRKTSGVTKLSIPWSAITLEPNQNLEKRALKARIGSSTVIGPGWCLKLAFMPDA